MHRLRLRQGSAGGCEYRRIKKNRPDPKDPAGSLFHIKVDVGGVDGVGIADGLGLQVGQQGFGGDAGDAQVQGLAPEVAAVFYAAFVAVVGGAAKSADQVPGGVKGFAEMIELSNDVSMVEINVKEEWVGKSLVELSLRRKYSINVVAIRNGDTISTTIDPALPLEQGMELIVIASTSKLKKLK